MVQEVILEIGSTGEQQMKLHLLACRSSALQAGSQQDRELGTPVLKDTLRALLNYMYPKQVTNVYFWGLQLDLNLTRI